MIFPLKMPVEGSCMQLQQFQRNLKTLKNGSTEVHFNDVGKGTVYIYEFLKHIDSNECFSKIFLCQERETAHLLSMWDLAISFRRWLRGQ